MKIIHLLLGSLLILAACKKDNYLVDEGNTNLERIRKMPTYDFLKESKVLDTVVMLIDRAGMKDEINGDITFFSPTNSGVANFLAQQTRALQRKYNNENIKFTLDSLTTDSIKFYLRRHIFKGVIDKKAMSYTKKSFTNINSEGNYFLLLEKYYIDVSGIRSTTNRIQIRRVFGLADEDVPDGTENREPDFYAYVQTSEVRTATGMVHVLEANANMGFYIYREN
ncbi:Fasciclin domain-containing protein [Chitinophaga ginsengisegetis]|uniref:Fasciclin domain-containing protein n=1 Tax=Chitinophaga ginsengisegetis TaxID=393003 RepID=A0A1T5NA72_9BACT|nr:fasciclin domain-containing protein [Chitinophaga ginsengisegetis]SKC97326.1 Fasciclin domain-containing protein [Chitinophaga ginsengisegetis]